ncbi:uncharacterized protein si:dkey-112e17.1 isoform X1 [Stegostoma tigrinum]|uniref:uncharacterized protein si:dkey-112e17.1 isoform X1 n=2 Tax=Stegostoma tigrinum TaxID=3053191 RepID=UPI00202B3F5D|nr:uncharacterized protein si:dkey-112e17.1 isoform X1 [Stegostoma tigrinum]
MEQNSAGKLLWILTLGTVCVCSVEPTSRRVYYTCGAVVDSEAQGIILSPGFPTSYVPGTHCLWQFFIPAGVRLVLEVFDFDVFESQHNAKSLLGDQSTPVMTNGGRSVSGPSEKRGTVQSRESNDLYPHAKEYVQSGRRRILFNETNVSNSKRFEGDYSMTHSYKAKDKQVVAQEESATLEMVKMPPLKQDFVSTDSWLGKLNKNDSEKSNLSVPHTGFGSYQDMNADPQLNSEWVQKGEKRLAIDQRQEQQVNDLTEFTVTPVTKVTPLIPPEICPNDVLYISDLITFSARFCGANSPINKTLMFGSSLEMVEVVVELITTTDRGRGFLLLYQFKTGTDPDLRTLVKHGEQDNLIHFLVIASIAILSAVLLVALCHTWRKKAHCKGGHSHCSRRHENGIQNSAVDIGEMQLVANRTNQEVSLENENNNHSISLGGMGNSNRTDVEMASSESAVTETGSDEIFVISTGLSLGNLHFSSFKTKVPKRSPMRSSPTCDWLAPDLLVSEGEKPPLIRKGESGGASPTQQCAWSIRNFHDALGPLPQPPRDWRDWMNTSSFTKLVENCGTGNSPSGHHIENKRKVVSDMQLETELEQTYDSSGSAASYPLAQSAQSHRGLFTGTNLRKAWFGSPCFGFRPNARQHNLSVTTNCDNRTCQQPDPQPVPSHQGPRFFTDSSVSNNIKSLHSDSTKTRHLANQSDRKTLTKPVFVISEVNEDRQPLVKSLHPAGLSGNLAQFEEVTLDKVKKASDVQERNHPINAASLK